MFTFCKTRWARWEKWKENQAIKETKIPKNKRQKYRINETNIDVLLHVEVQFLLSKTYLEKRRKIKTFIQDLKVPAKNNLLEHKYVCTYVWSML